MKAMIERLEKATGPDRALDTAILQATDPNGYRIDDDGTILVSGDMGDGPGWFNIGYEVPEFTHSIDAALTLVPENGRLLELGQWSDNGRASGWFAQVTRWHQDGEFSWRDQGYSYGVPEVGATTVPPLAPNGAIALCIAALKARESVR